MMKIGNRDGVESQAVKEFCSASVTISLKNCGELIQKIFLLISSRSCIQRVSNRRAPVEGDVEVKH